MLNRLFLLPILSLQFASGADVTIHASEIPLGDYSVTPFETADGKLEMLMSGSTYSAGGAVPGSFGGAAGGNNVNAFDSDDLVTMTLTFANDAGLREFASIWTNTSVEISGFVSDPGVSTNGAGNGTATYDDETGSVTLSQGWEGNTVILYDFANPAASAGQTLTFTFGGGSDNYQWAMNRITYEDRLVSSGPVILAGLAAATDSIVGVSTVLEVEIDTAILPAPTYLWEFDDGSGFVEVGSEARYPLVGGAETDGAYRVTLDNGQGTASSSTLVTSSDDGDGVDNQWEIDFFGDHLLYDAGADPDGDGRVNAQEFADGTDPDDEDSDGDGLTDGEEAAAGTNPVLIDTDGDGYGDGYEVDTASTDPLSVAESPGVSAGRRSIGVTFGSSRGLNPGVNLSTTAIAGVPEFAQSNWNVSEILGNTGQISQEFIAGPSAGVLVDSDGNETSMEFEIEVASTWSTNFNPELPIGGLLSGYLHVTPASPTGTLDLSGIPYDRYDVVIYMINQFGDGTARIREVNSDPLREFTVRHPVRVFPGQELVWGASSDPSAESDGSFENFPTATHVVFRGLTGSEASFDLSRVIDNSGFAAIQVVEDLDGDGDDMGDFYEAMVGLDPVDDGSIDPEKEGADGDFDGDGISNLEEQLRGTDPASNDSDQDGLLDQHETDTGFFVSATNTGTDPLVADSDGDGASDGLEVMAGVDPFSDGDTDLDGYSDTYELVVGATSPTDPNDPGSPNGGDPISFAIAFDSSSGPGVGAVFGELAYAGAPGVEQKNWNRTNPFANSQALTVGGTADIAGPQVASLVDSVGEVLSSVTFEFTSSGGAYAAASETGTPYGLLFNSWIYGPDGTETTVSVENIPYDEYDVYVYFGSGTNGRQARVGSATAGTIYSFTTGSNSLLANSVIGETYVETTDTGEGYPVANYAVFRGLTASSVDVFTTWETGQGGNVGIYGVQIVGSAAGGAALPQLTNLVRIGNQLTGDLTVGQGGTYILERSLDLRDPWEQVGLPLVVVPGTSQFVDSGAPAGKAFYRVRRQ